MAKLPGCTVVGRSPQDVQDHFRLKDWPRGSATIDLGGRVLDVIPIPGHHPAHIALYDRETRILLTGDTLYPGRLYVYDMPEYLSSVERLASFVEKNPVTWILGAHVEMTSTPFREYKVKSLARIDEHALQLAPSALDLLLEECRKMKDAPKRQVLDEFVIYPMNRR
jgi:glyoxylase-like metal-dependent hydrolase (beta-lactamase superfamily II)